MKRCRDIWKCSKPGFGGVVDEGSGFSARFLIGLEVGKPRSGSMCQEKGALLEAKDVLVAFRNLRKEQVGASNANATITQHEGFWEIDGEKPEATVGIEIEFMPTTDEPNEYVFMEDMLDLAERSAELFGQKEVWVHMGGRLYRANAPDEPAPEKYRKHGRAVR